MPGAIRLDRTTEQWSRGWNRLVPASTRTELWSPGQWLTRDFGQGVQPILNFCGENRGVYSEALLLGRVRKATDADRQSIPLGVSDQSLQPLYFTYWNYQATSKALGADRAELTLRLVDNPEYGVTLTIDTSRHVVLSMKHFDADTTTQTTEFSEFVEAAGSWWATKIVTTNANTDHPSTVVTQEVRVLVADEVDAAFTTELARRQHALLLPTELPAVDAAKLARKNGSATLVDRFLLLLHHSTTQNWEPVYEELRSIEALAAEKPGAWWLRVLVHQVAGRREDQRQLIEERLTAIAPANAADRDQLGPAIPGSDLYLTDYLLSLAYNITDWNEYGRLVVAAKPIYERQADRDIALLDWKEKQLSVDSSLGNQPQALAMSLEIARMVPHDVNRQINYAQRLVNLDRIEEALAWLKQQRELPDHWTAAELGQLRMAGLNFLEQRGRWEEVLAFLDGWIAENPANDEAYSRYLTALVMNDESDRCDETAQRWLDEIGREGELPASVQAQLRAAVHFALGNGHNLQRYYGVDPRWRQPLYKVAMIAAQRSDRETFADLILGNHHFYSLDEGDRLRGHLVAWTLDGLATMTPERAQRYFNWLQQGRLLVGEGEQLEIRQVTQQEWEQIAAGLLARWESAESPADKHSWGESLFNLYAARLPDERLPFARRLIAEGPADYQPSYRQRLYDLLLAEPWTEAIEAELFALWANLSQEESEPLRLFELLPLLYQLNDTLVSGRYAAAQRALHDAGRTDELTRTEIAEKSREHLRDAREGVAARLMTQIEQRGAEAGPLGDWLRIERLYLDAKLDRNRGEILAECWRLLGDAPPQPTDDANTELTDEQVNREVLATLLRERAWDMVRYYVARRDAGDKLIDRTLAYVDAGIARAIEQDRKANAQRAQAADDPAEPAADVIDTANAWRAQKYELLLVLDRPDELVAALEQWSAASAWNVPWKLALARLHAERGDIADAVKLLEAVRDADELPASDLKLLADLYLVQDNRAGYDAARIEALQAAEEYQLSNALQHVSNQLDNGEGPHELEDSTLLMVRALFQKTSSPGSYYWVLQDLYRGTLDFRLLKIVPETVLGRTRQEVYSALGTLNNSIIAEIRKEATADELLAHLETVRASIQNGETPRGADANERSQQLDLRALDLLEAMVERRAAEVQNQPGPHVRQAIAALQRAFDRGWAEGERRQMAELLYQLGSISNRELSEEQLRELEQLRADSEPRSDERLWIAFWRARVLFDRYDRRPDAVRYLDAALREHGEQTGGIHLYTVGGVVTGYSDMLQSTGAYQQAEQFIQRQLDGSDSDERRRVYTDHLNQLYEQAMRESGQTSLGKGHAIFGPLLDRLMSQSGTVDDNRRYNLLHQFGNVLDYGCEQNLPEAKPRLLDFTTEALPELLATQQNYYENLIQHFAEIIARRVDKLEALAFMLDRVEKYPPRFEYGWQDAWSRHAYYLADYRFHAHQVAQTDEQRTRLEALEARLLPLVLAEMRRDLSSQHQRSRYIYSDDYQYFWNEQLPTFLATANDVLDEFRDSPRTIVYTAQYFYHGLSAFDRAIEVLLIAERRGLLDDSGLSQLVDYLHERNRYAESISLLEPYVERQPDLMHLRVLLLRAYHHAQRPEQFDQLAAATDEHFHQEGRWVEGNIAQFATVMVEAKRNHRGAELWEEVISLHQRNAPNRGIGDGTLIHYYTQLAQAYSQLGDTAKAVDAASGAIVSWGNDQVNREAAINKLREILHQAKDVAAYVRKLDEQAQQTGADSPVIRKALGQVYQARKRWELAITQFKLAIELQPNDREVHQALLACYDATGDQQAAVQQLLAQIDFDRHNLEAYKSLAERTKGDPALAERAATSIVESAPNEAESHQALAEYRQSQADWAAAVPHWRRVAELRKLEPTGLLGLAKAQLEARQWQSIGDTLKQLRTTEWPSRFGDVQQQVRELEAEAERRKQAL
ncbi:MAG: hypothetical protein R3B90_19985 [Planctomycetaceae bacterium]